MGSQEASWPMPWTETCPMDQRVAFIADWLRDEWTMTELAARYQISRKTAYKWVDRYERTRRRGWRSDRGRRRRTDGRWPRSPRGDAGVAARASASGGPRNLRAILREREPDAGLAGREHDGRSAAPGRTESAAAAAALCRAVDAAVGGGAAAE